MIKKEIYDLFLEICPDFEPYHFLDTDLYKGKIIGGNNVYYKKGKDDKEGMITGVKNSKKFGLDEFEKNFITYTKFDLSDAEKGWTDDQLLRVLKHIKNQLIEEGVLKRVNDKSLDENQIVYDETSNDNNEEEKILSIPAGDSYDDYEIEAEKIDEEINNLQLEGEYREAVVKQRVNQGEFRKILLKKYDSCCLCGVKNTQLLVASHIMPWSVSDKKQRLNPNNGFLMCPDHDKLFDKGYISFNDDGRIIISSELNDADKFYMNIDDSMSIELSEENKFFLNYHRNNIFKE